MERALLLLLVLLLFTGCTEEDENYQKMFEDLTPEEQAAFKEKMKLELAEMSGEKTYNGSISDLPADIQEEIAKHRSQTPERNVPEPVFELTDYGCSDELDLELLYTGEYWGDVSKAVKPQLNCTFRIENPLKRLPLSSAYYLE